MLLMIHASAHKATLESPALRKVLFTTHPHTLAVHISCCIFFIQLCWLVRKTFVKMVGLAQDMSMTTLVNVLLVTLASPVKKKVYTYGMWQY